MPRSKRTGRVTRMARPTWRGCTMLVVGLAGIVIAYPLGRREIFYVAALLVLLPVLGYLLVRFRPVRLAVHRSFDPAVVPLGGSSIATLTVRNLAPTRTPPMLWRDTLPWSPYSVAPAELAAIPSGRAAGAGAAELRYDVTPPRRGVFEIGPFVVELTDPFGLATGALSVGQKQTMIVTPDVVPFSDGAVAIAADEGSTLVLQRRAVGGEDDITTREYRRGDAMRRVHWRASAHHGELMVRQEEQRSHAEARVLIDTLRGSYADAIPAGPADAADAESESFEWAVAFAASLALHLQRSGFLVQLIETGRSQVAAVERADEFLESLAAIELIDERAENVSLLGEGQRPDRSQGSVFAVIADADPATVERLVTQRASFDLAVAYLITPHYEAFAELLASAGWTCIVVNPSDPVGMAWLALGAAQEAGMAISLPAIVTSTANPRRPAVQPGRELRVSLALLLLVLVTLAGLHVMLARVVWFFPVGLLAAAILGVAALVRHFSVHRWLPPLVAAAAYLVGLTVFFAADTAVVGLVPTADTVARFSTLFDDAGRSIASQSIPANADESLVFLICVGVGAIAWAVDLFALVLRAPAFAGVPVLVLLAVPGFAFLDTTDVVVFVAAALLYLHLLVVGRARQERHAGRAIAVAVVVGSLVVPALLPAVSPAQDVGGGGISTGVNPVLTLGRDLRQDVDHTVLTYTTRSGDPHYLRMVSIDNFSGSDWAPDRFQVDARNTPASIAAAPGLSGEVATAKDTETISVQNLTSPWLPLPYPTSKVTGLDGNWYWDRTGLAMRGTDVTAAQQQYTASSLTPAPTPAQLQAAGSSVPAGFDRYLALPEKMPALIPSTAAKVAGGAASNYEKALLLQQYLREGNFTYSETAPVDNGYDSTGMEAIGKFLVDKEGYCIHFSSAMAVMARSLGIPSRVAVGFLPGSKDGQVDGRSNFEVTSHDLHAWPELYFEGIGWTRFEPTVGRGEVPSYADRTEADVPAPINSPDPAASAAASSGSTAPGRPLRDDPAQAADGSVAAASAAPWLWLVVVILIVGLVLLVPAPVRLLQRRRRLARVREGRASPRLAWQEVLQSAEDLGERMPDTATPRAVAVALAAGRGVEVTTPMTAPARVGARATVPAGAPARAYDDAPIVGGALGRLLAAVERAGYAPDGTDVASPSSAADVLEVIATLRARAPAPDRNRAFFAPPSIWSTLLGLLSRMG